MPIYLKKNNLFKNQGFYYNPNNNTANYDSGASWNGVNANLTSVGTNGRSSYYGTYDQTGNVSELLNNVGPSTNSSLIRGGEWRFSILNSNSRGSRFTASSNNRLGFRISSLYNPLNLKNFVSIYDINNPSDVTGYGSVLYNYTISKYPVTNCEYVEFLNSVAKTDSYALYDINMTNDIIGGINRTGFSGNYAYNTKPYMWNKPVVYINWFNAARYCNWLHNGKPKGSQDLNTTEDGAYLVSGIFFGDIVNKKNNSLYWICTENEWYKAAYYSPIKNGINSPGYYLYATQSDTEPEKVTADITGNGIYKNKLANISDYTCESDSSSINPNLLEVFARWI